MGLLLIFLGLLTAGVVVDFIAENHLLSASNETFVIFGMHVTVSGAAEVVAGFLAGMIALLLIVLGVGLLRGSWGRRRALKQRIAELEWQNTELRSRQRLEEVVNATHAQSVVQVPEVEVEAATEPEQVSTPAPRTTHEEISTSS
jgi:hypothetical protein